MGAASPLWPLNPIKAEVAYGERLIPQIIDEQAETIPNRVIGKLAKNLNINDGFTELTIKQLASAINFTSWWIEHEIGKSKFSETIAFLGENDFRYWIMEYAAVKCEYVSTKCKTIFYSASMEPRVAEITSASAGTILVIRVPELEEMLAKPAKAYPYTKTWEAAKDDNVIIVHSSGSTGTPKPCHYSHSFLATFDMQRFIPSIDGRPACGLHMYGDPGTSFFMAFPFFHLAGVSASLAPFYYDCTLILPPIGVPANGKVVIDIMQATELTTMFCPPSILEDVVSEHSESFIQCSKELKAVCFGGGPLAPATGNFLAQRLLVGQGIGSTEAGMLPNVIPHRENWQYFEWHPSHAGARLEPLEDGSELYEIVIYRDPKLVKYQGIFITHPHVDVWHTSDIFEKHPTKDLWLFAGRRDDIIVLSNGEKFNPVTMEGIIQGNSKLSGALVVGTRKNQCGLLLEVRGDEDVDVIDEVWATIEKANEVSPGHAQIARNMVAIVNPKSSTRRFLRAPKGTIVRWSSVNEFADLISELFSNSGDSVSNLVLPQPPDLTTAASIRQLIRDLVSLQVKERALEDADNLFSNGFDSLKTARLVADLQSVFKDQVNKSRISPRMVYENPSIDRIAVAVERLVLHSTALGINGPNDTLDVDVHRSLVMKTTLDRLSSNLPRVSRGTPRISDSRLNVLVTGTTGSLGGYLLEVLLADTRFGDVYLLNRAADARDQFMHRSVGADDVERVEFLKASFGERTLGLSAENFQRLVDNVDVIIHNAWQLDFNLTLESFEKIHLKGVRTFIDWVLTAERQPSLHFVSSASAMGLWPNKHPNEAVPEIVSDPEEFDVALPMGYGESKHVAEKMLRIASLAGARINILRVGQIAGPSANSNGLWTLSEWFPSLVKSSKAMKVLPQTLGSQTDIDWIPVNILAQIIVDIVQTTISDKEGTLNVFNLVNPHRTKVNLLIDTISKEYDLDVVPYKAWIGKVMAINPTKEQNLEAIPVLKLLDFFGELALGGEVPMQTKHSQKASQTMATLTPLSDKDVKGWIRKWAY